MVLKFDRNRPKATCRKTQPQIDPETLALAVRLRALKHAGENLTVIEDLLQHKEQRIGR